MRTTRLLPVLLLVSGFCGISYEILYSKLLGNLLGNQFTINASVLLTFLFGIGVGTLLAHRFVRWLWAIEAGIGLYAALMVASYGWLDRVLYSSVSSLGTSLVACAAVSILLLVVPAFLVGCSVPLFAAYLSTLRSTHVFSLTYGIYNFGAVLTALGMEFILLRSMGLRATTLTLAALNGLVAVGLLLLVRSAPVVPAPRLDRLRFSPRDLTALTLASVGSAMFQLIMIRIAECLYGPFNETFALVLAVVFLGLALGSLVVGSLRLSFGGSLLLALAGIVTLLAFHPAIATLHAMLRPEAVRWYPVLVGMKLGLVLLMMGLSATGFGATIPALLSVHRDLARESGQLLFVSSMGNVLGFVLLAFVLHPILDYGPLLLIIAALILVALLIHAGPRRGAAWAGVCLTLLAVAAERGLWQERYLYFGHVNFRNMARLDRVRHGQFVAEKFKGRQDVFALTSVNGRESFFANGYNSIPLRSVAEKVAGALSVMFSPRLDEAMVLGIGSGATAGTVGLFFDHVDAVDINAVIFEHLDRMAEFNFNLGQMPNVTRTHDDGIHFIKTTPKRYSLIVNTVESPDYFSSSKLYTRDFLEDVVSRLTPDGIYTTWLDQDMGDRGVNIILRTLDSVFERCAMGYLKSSYYLFVCSNAEVKPAQVEPIANNVTFDRYFAKNYALLSRLTPYSVLMLDVLPLGEIDYPIHTLDFPVLEHEMTGLRRTKILKFNQRLGAALDLTRTRAAFDGIMDWDPAEFSVWRDMRTGPGSTLGGILDAQLFHDFGDLRVQHEAAALEIAKEVGTPAGFYVYGVNLYRRGHYEAALQVLLEAVALNPSSHDALFRLGRCYEKLDQPERAREYYAEAVRLGARIEDTRWDPDHVDSSLDHQSADADEEEPDAGFD